MLFNPKWNKETDFLTIPCLILWLETMPADEPYDYRNCKGECMIGQFMRANGFAWSCTAYRRWARASTLIELVAMRGPYTFGHALQRAKAIQQTL